MGSHYNPPEVIAPLSTSDHNMVIWMAKTQQRFVNIVKKIKFRPTPRYNLQQFGSCLAQYDWSTVLNVENVDEKVEDFTRATNDMINYYFPERTVRMHSDDKFFITTKIKRLLRKRDNAYKQGRMQKFRELRNRVASEIRKAKRHYYVMNIGRLNTNGDARMWWKKVWKLTGKKKSSINLSEQGSDSKLEDKDAANMINTFFADLTNDFPEIQSRWSSYGHSDVLPTVTPESVAKKLLSIQSNKAPGPNDPYLKIIKMFAHSFAIPLANIFNASFVQKVSAFFNYISGGAIAPPGKEFAPPVKPFLPPKCEAELLMIAVRIAVDLLDNEIMPFHSLLHSHLVCNSYCSSPNIS